MGRVKGRGESRAKWQRQSWRREAVEAIQQQQRPRPPRPQEPRPGRAQYGPVIQQLLLESSSAASPPPPREKPAPTLGLQHAKNLRARSSDYLLERLLFASDLIERILRVMSMHIAEYSEEDLKHLLGYIYPPIHGPLSALCSLHNTLSESTLRVFLDSQPAELVIGSSVSDSGFISALTDECHGLNSFAAFDSWEDVDYSSEMAGCLASSLKTLCLIGSKVTLATLVASSTHIPRLECLVLHDIRICWSCTLDPEGILIQLTSRLRCLEELHLSYCEWMSIDVLEFWSNALLRGAPLTLKRVLVRGLTFHAEERRRVATMQGRLAHRGLALSLEET